MKKRNNGDFLESKQKEDIEDLAGYIANYYSPRNAVDVEEIAEKNCITFTYDDYGDAFDGLLEHSFGRFHIYININRLGHPYTERARFTFAHELGHFFIDNHRTALEQGLTPSHPSFTGFVSNNLAERQADFFASCLLLPKERVIKDCFRRKFEFRLIQELSKKYQTSLTATSLRYAVLGIYPIMVVYSIDNIIKWYWYTYDFPFYGLKYGKAKVPENTAVGEFFSKKVKYNSSEIVYADDWFKVFSNDDYNRQFFEHCIYGRNNSVISIIWEN